MAEQIVKDVKSKGAVVGQVTIEKFDNLDEAEESLGSDECIRLINKMHAVETMDAERRKVTGTASTGTRELLNKLKEDPEKLAELLKAYNIESNLL